MNGFMNNTVRIKNEIPVLKNVDVAVIGGGTAGCFAAIAAAKTGAKTLLVEKNGLLGGTMTAAGVNYPGLFFAWGEQIIAGPCWEAVLRTVQAGGASLPRITKHPAKHWQEQIRLDSFIYTCILEQMCIENGVELVMHTMVSAVQDTAGGVELVFTSKEGLWGIRAKAVIDATGDADAAGLAGYRREKSGHLQPATLINDIAGYDIDQVDSDRVNAAVEKALLSGEIKIEDIQGGNLFGQLRAHRISMHVTDVDASTSGGNTAAEVKARRQLAALIAFLKTIPGLENTYVSRFAQECGIRETFRIAGEKTVTKEDYLNGTVYDDAVCFAFYPVDLHVPDGIMQIFLRENIVPTIPYGALIPKGSKRLLAAGRCLSADTQANSACRVQAVCMATGQAAGVAAALAARLNISVNEISIERLHSGLKSIGAIVPV